MFIQHDQLAGLHFAEILGADQVEGAALGGDHPTLFQPAQTQGPEAIGVARRHHALLGQQHDRERAAHPIQGVNDPRQEAVRAGMGDQMDDHLAVGRGLEDRAVRLQLVAEHGGIDQIPVVGQGEVPEGKIHNQRLDILEMAVPGGGIAVVTDGHVAGQALQHLLGIDVRHEAHRLFLVEVLAVRGDDAGAFLAAVLQGIEAQVGQVGRFLVAIDPEHPALVAKFVRRDQLHIKLSALSRPCAHVS